MWPQLPGAVAGLVWVYRVEHSPIYVVTVCVNVFVCAPVPICSASCVPPLTGSRPSHPTGLPRGPDPSAHSLCAPVTGAIARAPVTKAAIPMCLFFDLVVEGRPIRASAVLILLLLCQMFRWKSLNILRL